MLYFERLVVDVAAGRVLEAVIAEQGLWRGGRLLVKALGKDDHEWVIEVLGRALVEAGYLPKPSRLRLEGEATDDALRYTAFLDDGAGLPLTHGAEELEEIISALSGLVEIH